MGVKKSPAAANRVVARAAAHANGEITGKGLSTSPESKTKMMSAASRLYISGSIWSKRDAKFNLFAK